MKKILQTLCAAIIITGSIAIFPNEVSATTIGPDKYFLDISSGSPIRKELTIYGDFTEQTSRKLYLNVVGMKKVGEEHDRDFYTPDKNNNAELANLITLDTNEVTLEAGNDTIIGWELIPNNSITCGTNLAAIMVSSSPSEANAEGASVGIKNNVISQIHVNVTQANGQPCPDNKVKLSLVEFKLNKNSKFFSSPDVPFLTRISNEGNLISQAPQGFIEVFGYGEKVTIPFNQEGLDIYPGTTRKFDNVWLDANYPKDGGFFTKLMYEVSHLRFGKYEARLGVARNATPPVISTVTFWIIPWRIVLVLLLLTLVILGLIYHSIRSKREVKKLKNSNKRL